MLWINATNLENWASMRDCQGYLPLVVRRLIRATSENISHICFSAGDSIICSGWDGVLKVLKGTEYIPEGLSVWEIGSSGDVKKKVEKDYKKRKENSLGVNPKEASLIFVTPRTWSAKDEWCKEKKAEGFWKDVRVYDARTLEEWLEQAPVVSAWLAKRLRIYSEGVIALEDWWKNWRSITNPQLTSKLVLAGRDREIESVKKWLNSSPASIAVQAFTSDEALAFLAAAIDTLPENEREFYLSKSLVVEKHESFKQIMVTGRAGLLLVSSFEDVESSPLATHEGHFVYIPLSPDNKVSTGSILLPRLGRDAFVSALQEMGLSKEDAEKYSIDTGRNLTVLRRRLAGISNQPEWAKPATARDIIPVLLAGRWFESKDGDKEIIAQLSGESYEAFSKKLYAWQHKSDSAVLKIGEEWRLVSPVDAWFALASFLAEADLREFKSVILKVLGSRNPALDLEPEKRWMSAVYGKQPFYSGPLREGIVQTLIFIAMFGDEAKIAVSSTQTWVDNIVRELFQNADWKLWRSLYDVLPFIAEASPSSFFEAVEFSLSQSDRPVMGMFSEAENTLTSSSAHSSLLWALEGLAWSSHLLGRVTLILGKLARFDPGGKLSNRPVNSLRTIFLLWRPYTYASLEQRLGAIDVLLEREPEIGWQLLVNLKPRSHDASSPTYKPRWRQFSEKTEILTTIAERLAAVKAVIERLLRHVGNNGKRWSDVLNNVYVLPPDERHRILEQLLSSIDNISDGRSEVRDGLREFLSHHRSFSDANWALPEQELKEVEKIYLLLEPTDTIDRFGWLFNDNWPDLPEGGKNDIKKADQIVAQRRLEAVKAIKSEYGLDGLIKLAEQAKNTRAVSFPVVELELTPEEEQKLFSLLGNENQNKAVFIQDYISRCSFKKGDEWIVALVEMARSQQWSEVKIVNLFLSFPQKKEVWDLLKSFSETVRDSYWKRCSIGLFHSSIEETTYAIKQLLRVKRHFTALDAAALFIDETPAELILEILQKAATEKCEEDFRIQSYDIERLFAALDKSSEIKEEEMVRLEWLYLPILAGGVYNLRPPKTLHKELAGNPEFFAEVIKYLYKPRNEERKDKDESLPPRLIEQRAHLAAQLLESWTTVPGSDSNGQIEYQKLKAWVDRARELCRKIDRKEGGDNQIGQVLAHSFSKEESIWPPESICKIIDEIQSERLNNGFTVEIYNKRGVVSKSLSEGGQQERKLAEQFKEYAENWSIRYPKTASLLREVAEGYENQAKREDKMAERRDLEY